MKTFFAITVCFILEHDDRKCLEWENIVQAKIKRLLDDQFSQDLLLMSSNDTEIFHISDGNVL